MFLPLYTHQWEFGYPGWTSAMNQVILQQSMYCTYRQEKQLLSFTIAKILRWIWRRWLLDNEMFPKSHFLKFCLMYLQHCLARIISPSSEYSISVSFRMIEILRLSSMFTLQLTLYFRDIFAAYTCIPYNIYVFHIYNSYNVDLFYHGICVVLIQQHNITNTWKPQIKFPIARCCIKSTICVAMFSSIFIAF